MDDDFLYSSFVLEEGYGERGSEMLVMSADRGFLFSCVVESCLRVVCALIG